MSTSIHGGCMMISHVVPNNRQSVHALLVVVLLLSLQLAASLPLDQFYPFNITSDAQTERKDDGGSPLINLPINFTYFNKTNYNTLYVNNNGIISFLDKLTTYKPTNFSDGSYDDNIAILAPFWADIDIENIKGLNETVVYRQTNESEILDRATQDVRNYFVGQQNFSAELVFIVTWYNVGFYGATEDGKNKRNTFQSVMITNGQHSFVIYNYNKTVWTTGSNSGGHGVTGLGGDPAVAGFHSGNGTYFMIEYSGTDEIVNISQRSNLPNPIPGKYIFRVDGPQVNNLSCAASDKLVISPTSISMLGHEFIKVKGPCLNTDFSVKARILEVPAIGTFDCHVTSEGVALCVPPSLFRTGELTFELNINNNGWEHSATLISVNLLSTPAKLTRYKPDDWLSEKLVRVIWTNQRVVPMYLPKTLEVMAYSKSDVAFHTVLSKNVSDDDNTYRSFKLRPDEGSDFSPYSSLVTRLCWQINTAILKTCIWSDVFPVRWKKQNSKESLQWCNSWIEEERSLPHILVKPPYCPCIQSIADGDKGHFHRDPICDSGKTNVSTNCIYNPDAHMCYRRNLKSATDNGETCCYKSDGELMDIREYSGAGTHQRYHYKAQEPDSIVPFFSYFEGDLLPKLHCCQYSQTNCSGFKELRNATTCSGYTPPSPAQAAGDPHIVTLDGKGYSFNGLGDFYLVQHVSDMLVIQVRAVQATDDRGDPQNASVFSQVAVAMPSSSDSIVVRKTNNGGDVLVNGQIVDLSTSEYTGKNISIYQQSDDGSYQIVMEPVSVSVTVEITPDLLNCIVLIGEESFKGNIRGLLGNYNKDPADDFIASNGTILPEDASMKQIHYHFGMTWAVAAGSSFLVDDDTTVVDNSAYKPVFIGEIADDEKGQEAKELCGDNIQCSFDYLVTGKESVAAATKSFTNKFDKLKKELDQVVIRCPFLETPPNGNRTVSGYTNGSIAEYVCNEGFEMITGSQVRYCQKDSTWSGSDVVCANKTVDTNKTSIFWYIPVAVGPVVILLIIAVSVKLYMKKRKPKPDPSPPPGLEMRGVTVFENQDFMHKLHTLVKDGRFEIPRPHYVDPSIFVEYF